MPRWAPAPTAVAAEAETTEQKEGSEASAKEKGEPATSGVSVSDWLAAAATTGTASGKESTNALGEERDQQDGEASGGSDGLSWLTQAADSHKPSAAASGIPSTAGVDSSEGDAGADWLAVAKSSGQAKRSPAVKRPSVGAAAPGGWMSSGKLGLSTGDGSDDDQAGKTSGSGGVAKPKKKKKARGSVSGTGGPGGWLSSGALGVPAKDESDEEEGSGGDNDRRGAAVTIETQTDDDIEAATRGAAEKGNTRKLPPWAKPYVPPDPIPEVVPDTAAEPTIEKQELEPAGSGGVPSWLAAVAGAPADEASYGSKNSDALGQERALEADEGGVGQASGGNDGLGWLTEAASKDTAAATPASTSAPDWLSDATSRGMTKHNKSSTAAKRASIRSAAPGGWMSSGNIGLSTGDDGSDEDQTSKTDRGSAKPRKKKKQQPRRGSVSAAGGPAGWLSSGALGVPAQDESDEDGGDSDGGRPLMATTETQTEDNIEEATKTANGPKLPPWAKPWTPPPPEPEAEPVTDPDPPSEQQEHDTPATPDWILASLGPDAEGAAAAPAPAGSPGDWLVQENQAGGGPAGTGGGSNGPDWLQQATAAPTAKPANRWRGAATQRPGGGRKAAAQSPLSWMTSMKRRSSMDLNDQGVEEAIAQAKAKTIPGGWLQMGALGAPDAVEEANALEEARAASSLTRTSTNGKGTPGAAAADVRRPSLEQGLPPWAPKSTTTALASSSSSRGRRTSFSGGTPAWAPQHQQGGDSPSAEQLKARADESPEGRRPGLAGGMPSWTPADKKVAAGSDGSSRRRRRSSLDGGMPAWAPAAPGRSPTSRSRGQEEDELPVPEPEQATPALPDWLTAAAGGGSALKDTRGDGEGTIDTDDDGGGLGWLAQAASGGTTSKSQDRKSSQEADDTGCRGSSGNGDDVCRLGTSLTLRQQWKRTTPMKKYNILPVRCRGGRLDYFCWLVVDVRNPNASLSGYVLVFELPLVSLPPVDSLCALLNRRSKCIYHRHWRCSGSCYKWL
ncbi:unnamed protein product [Ectocarpus sp. 8 AP-2014]